MGLGVSALVSCAPDPPPPAPTPRPSQIIVPPTPTPRVVRRPVRKTPPHPQEPTDNAVAALPPDGGPPGPPSSEPPAIAPSGPTANAPTEVPPPASQPPAGDKTMGLVGLDQQRAREMLGTATETVDQSPATIWRYRRGGCELDLVFYFDLRSGQRRALRYDVKGAQGEAARRACVTAIAGGQNNPPESSDGSSAAR
jgi:hypothetical protein